MRGRTNSDNETVNGNCTVGGSETVGGPLTVGYSNPTLTVNDTSGVNAAQVFLQSAASTIWGISKTSPGAANKFQIQRYNAGALVDSPFTIDNATGVASFAQRPTFATKTPWDNGNLVSPWSTANLANPATTDTTQTLAGAKTFSAATQFNGYGNFAAPFVGTYLTSTINLSSSSTVCGFGFNAGGFGATFRLAGSNSPAFQFMDFQASTFIPIVCSTVTQTSDEALKTDIAPVSGVLQKLRNKRTVSYTFKRDDNKTRHVGVIAQEWQSDFPELVVDAGVDIDADGDFIAHQYDASGNEIFGPSGKPESRRALGFNYGNASAVALQGVIELQAALDLALARIAALEAAAK
jgi:hypothetical protein